MIFTLQVRFGVIFCLIKWCLAQYGENFNACVDSCSIDFEYKYIVDLENNKSELKDSQLIEILNESYEASEKITKILLRIPFFNLKKDTILKLELEYDNIIQGTTVHIGNSPTNDLFGGDQNTTIFNAEIYSNDTSFNYYMNSVYLCDQGITEDLALNQEHLSKLLFLNQTDNILSPKSKTIIYVGEKWFRIDSLEKNSSLYYNNNYLFTFTDSTLNECKNYPVKSSPYLYIGLNRMIANNQIQSGNGLKNFKISMLNCFVNQEPDMKINIKEMKYTYGDGETLSWFSPLSYMEPSNDHVSCSAQGVVKVRFEPNSSKKIARFDLEFGEDISGYTFNIGDSPTNNGFGGDAGSTSNSAEIHTNEKRFYIWLNTKYCGDTLLYKIEYNLLESFDNLTIYISDQRIEIKNSRGYHQIYKNEYFYQLNSQNVTCNCFDTRCYPGAVQDNDLYFSINRVIGGVFRPGIGLCQAKISWLQCNKAVKTNQALSQLEFDEKHSKRHLNIGKGKPFLIDSSITILNKTTSLQEEIEN